MKPNETSSGPTSAATSTSAPSKPRDTTSDDASQLTESEFLARQMEDARLAMAQTWGDLEHSLAGTVDVRLWTKQFPWIATGTAAGAGLAAGYFLTPRDKDEAIEMWEKLKEKFTRAKVDRNVVLVEPAAAPPQPTIFGLIAREAIKAVVPLLTTMAGAAIGAREGVSHNGRDSES